MPKSREKSTRKTHNMTKIREKKKCRAERIAEKAKGLRPNNTLSDRQSRARLDSRTGPPGQFTLEAENRGKICKKK
jgi:hypothetical protein